ncbi:MAG TPA: L,D-transpeptidase family protein [Acidimicrobiales bacterium]|nr:L,D-transpeptidase family protein [Acidimicrobiales bacterium]
MARQWVRSAARLGLAAALGAVVAGVAVYAATDVHAGPPPGLRRRPSATARDGETSSTTSGSTAASPPLRVLGVAPPDGATGVAGSTPIEIDLSAAPARDSALPTISPHVPGRWDVSGTTLRFVPSEPFLPLTDVTVTVPAGPQGLTGADGASLAEAVVTHFTVRNGSVLRLQELLSLLDYSPLAFTSAAPEPAASDEPAQRAALFDPPRGRFAWRNAGWPVQLLRLWRPGADNVMTRGLVMSFQADHGLTPNGQLTEALWASLLGALASGDVNTGGYNYALANQQPPETLTIWHDGTIVLRSAANTGIPQSPTADGTFPVYSRLRSQVMTGTNPDGSHYADPVQYVAYFNGGDAVHYLPRAEYGIPQSLGCIELPLQAAAQAWPYLAYGTLVTVIN